MSPAALLRRRAASVRRARAAAVDRRVQHVQAMLDDIMDMVLIPAGTRTPLVVPAGIVRDGVWSPSVWPHRFHGTLTTAQAHQVMQQHRECMTDSCAVRATARQVLREAGHMRADSSRPRTW
ncbi:hypothetical protein ACFROC_29195 [Nocardia tengchongensis]|uniref:hypothetical protein n=1 Tax=Nocardia tengchongensis TaxID=2055889 RepID=UPI003691140A